MGPGTATERVAAPAKPPLKWLLVALGVGLPAFFFLSSIVGPASIPIGAAARLLLYHLTGQLLPLAGCGPNVSGALCAAWSTIVWNAYVPGVLLALLCGAALGISGAGLQAVFRNPLADPFLLGLSSGAALGAGVVYLFVSPALAAFALPIAAFAGGLVPGLTIYLASASGRRPVETLILTGVALATLASALLSAILLYNPMSSFSVDDWLLGGINYATWNNDLLVLGIVLALGTVLALLGSELNLLQLGPEVANSLGVDAKAVTQLTILLATFITATAVAFLGIVGFVGLVSPHVVRRLAGVDYRRVLPLSAVFGGLLLLVSWDVAKGLIPQFVIPVGIPAAFIGAPFFIYLLYRRRSAGAAGAV